jgi:hypothetical protein
MHNIRGSLERRRAQRFRVALLVELTEGTAVTRDLSASGVFFEAIRTFVVGECIQFTLVLEHVDPERAVHLHCCGRVVRIEPRSTGVGVAVTNIGYRIDPGTDKARGCLGGRNGAHACSQ